MGETKFVYHTNFYRGVVYSLFFVALAIIFAKDWSPISQYLNASIGLNFLFMMAGSSGQLKQIQHYDNTINPTDGNPIETVDGVLLPESVVVTKLDSEIGVDAADAAPQVYAVTVFKETEPQWGTYGEPITELVAQTIVASGGTDVEAHIGSDTPIHLHYFDQTPIGSDQFQKRTSYMKDQYEAGEAISIKYVYGQSVARTVSNAYIKITLHVFVVCFKHGNMKDLNSNLTYNFLLSFESTDPQNVEVVMPANGRISGVRLCHAGTLTTDSLVMFSRGNVSARSIVAVADMDGSDWQTKNANYIMMNAGVEDDGSEVSVWTQFFTKMTHVKRGEVWYLGTSDQTNVHAWVEYQFIPNHGYTYEITNEVNEYNITQVGELIRINVPFDSYIKTLEFDVACTYQQNFKMEIRTIGAKRAAVHQVIRTAEWEGGYGLDLTDDDSQQQRTDSPATLDSWKISSSYVSSAGDEYMDRQNIILVNDFYRKHDRIFIYLNDLQGEADMTLDMTVQTTAEIRGKSKKFFGSYYSGSDVVDPTNIEVTSLVLGEG